MKSAVIAIIPQVGLYIIAFLKLIKKIHNHKQDISE